MRGNSSASRTIRRFCSSITPISQISLDNSPEQVRSVLCRPFYIPPFDTLSPVPSYYLSTYVKKSQFLQNLINIHNIDISIFQKDKYLSDRIILFDYQRDFVLYINFFKQLDIHGPEFSNAITRAPQVLSRSVDDLSILLEFMLETLKISPNSARDMVTACPRILTLSREHVARIISTLRSEMKLNILRTQHIVALKPRILTFDANFFKMVNDRLALTCGFPDLYSRVTILKLCPMVFATHPDSIRNRVKFITETMKAPRRSIVRHPVVLRRSVEFLDERHEFLRTFGRAQYWPNRPRFVDFGSFSMSNDAAFCEAVDIPLEQYNRFLKTR